MSKSSKSRKSSQSSNPVKAAHADATDRAHAEVQAQPDANATKPAEPQYEPAPQNPDDLHDWIKNNIGISIARKAIIDGHSPPFAYICHSFFEGRDTWPTSPTTPATPGDPDNTFPLKTHALPDNPLDTPASSTAPQQSPPPIAPIDCIVWANRGGGKTFLGALATALDLIFKPGIQIRILAGSMEQAQHMHHHLRNIFERDGLAQYLDGRITDRRIRLTNSSVVQLLAQSQASVRGTRVQKLRCDEVELFSPEVWQAAQLTTRSAQCGNIWVRGTVECLSTMHKPHGLMHKLIQESHAGARTLFKWGLVDSLEHCPNHFQCEGTSPLRLNTNAQNLPANLNTRTTTSCPLLPECRGRAKTQACGHIPIEDALQMKSRVSASVWESEMLCQRVDRSDSVFPEFDAAIHVVPAAPEHQFTTWLGGMDFGYRAPAVILWAALDAKGRLWIMDERIASHTLIDEHIRAIHNAPWPRLSWIGIDPAGDTTSSQTGESDASLMRQSGLQVRHRHSRVLTGLRLIRARLAPADNSRPRLFIHQRCTGLIKAMDTYHFDPQNPDSEEPVKDGPDHACDALRYLILNLDSQARVKVEQY